MKTTKIFSWQYQPGGKIKIRHIDNSRKGYADHLVIEDTGTKERRTYNARGTPEHESELISEVHKAVRKNKMTREEIYSALYQKLELPLPK